MAREEFLREVENKVDELSSLNYRRGETKSRKVKLGRSEIEISFQEAGDGDVATAVSVDRGNKNLFFGVYGESGLDNAPKDIRRKLAKVV